MYETVAEFSARMKRLSMLACPTDADRSFFDVKILEAKALGMTYKEGLEYVILVRNGGVD